MANIDFTLKNRRDMAAIDSKLRVCELLASDNTQSFPLSVLMLPKLSPPLSLASPPPTFFFYIHFSFCTVLNKI